MSYYAWGSGEAKLKEGTDTEKLREDLSELDGLDFNITRSIVTIFGSDNYYETEVLKFLENLSPYITEGKIVYSGDEDLHWRFVFNSKTGKWDEESGVVDYNMESYSEKEIIKKAISLGYSVSKQAKDEESAKDARNKKTEILKRIKPYKDFSLCRDLIAFGVGECFLSEEYAGFDEAVVAVEKEWLFNLLKDKGIENPLDFLQHEYTWYDSAEWFEKAAKEGKVAAIEFIS